MRTRRMRTKRTIAMLSMRFSDGSGAASASATASPPAPPPTSPAQPPADKTFTQEEMNRTIAVETQKAIEAYRLQAEQEKVEAEKLAKMNADEKLTHAQKQAQEATAELNAYKLKAEAVKIAAAVGLPACHLDTVDFKTIKADELNALIGTRAAAYKADVAAALNQALKQSPPETHIPSPESKQKGFEDRLADARKSGDTLAAVRIKREAAAVGVYLL